MQSLRQQSLEQSRSFEMPKDLEKQGKANSHDAKVEHHAADHLHKEQDKNCEKQERRRYDVNYLLPSSESPKLRHPADRSGTGHTLHEPPKKSGAGGKGTWGSMKDEIKMAEDDAKEELKGELNE